ncbi:PEP-CTERM sorting domain-containing protein [Roseibacillus ishigakijimensis]|uniref:PEP-CTERM sorting domain-containing protein n=1 Tax=Roseibacillus ishigakijimensis TaxID=454146 RepID=A0A934RSC6_9BACT|nr:PEP-CTERM sorting domain-containing protein [Roseibacillus ishigakijimensis]MBK1833631.1 PEP-CTERM sorting domain-containing protein [Roseibacillus ishigakijimensis]
MKFTTNNSLQSTRKPLAILSSFFLITAAPLQSAITLVEGSYQFREVTSASDLRNPGANLIAAHNFTSEAIGGTTVNGIPFTNVSSSLFTGGSLSSNAGSISFETATANYSDHSGSVPEFNDLFNGRTTNGATSGGNEVRLTFTTLDPSQTYTVQFLFGGADAQRTNLVMINDGSDINNRLGGAEEAARVFGGGDGQILAGIYSVSFTVTDTNPVVFMAKRSGPGGGAGILNGYVLSAVPEPSSLTLLGLSAFALAVRRRP